MAAKKAIDRAKADARAGKAATTQAGEFVKDEIEAIRAGKHGARSAKQAIAIGLSEARRAGVKVPPPKNASAATKRKAAQDTAAAKAHKPKSAKRSAATTKALQREGKAAVSTAALSKQAKAAAAKRRRAKA